MMHGRKNIKIYKIILNSWFWRYRLWRFALRYRAIFWVVTEVSQNFNYQPCRWKQNLSPKRQLPQTYVLTTPEITYWKESGAWLSFILLHIQCGFIKEKINRVLISHRNVEYKMYVGKTDFNVVRPEFSAEATANNKHEKWIHLQLIIQPANDTATNTEWQLSEVVLIQFVSSDDEHEVLGTCREL